MDISFRLNGENVVLTDVAPTATTLGLAARESVD